MQFLASSLVVLSVASLVESWVPTGLVTDIGGGRSSKTTSTIRNTMPSMAKTTTSQRSNKPPLRDLVDVNVQWFDSPASKTSAAVSQNTIDRRLRSAAERFIKIQSGYFSPMMPNDSNIGKKSRNNGMMVNNDLNFFNNPNNNNYNNNNNMMNNNGYYDYENGGYYDAYGNYYYEDPRTSILADDFVFRSPVIGPLTKWDYIEALDYFRVYEAFPDINPNCYGFTVDIIEPLKVRFFVKATGTYQNPLGGFLGSTAARLTPPDGRQYMGSTEAWSITFNDLDRMQVKSISAGYVVDRFEEEGLLCTTDGRGLIYGILNTIGLENLPSSPGSKSLELTQWLTGQFSKKGGPDALFPKMSSDPRTIPQWWGDKRLGAKE
mmetsp:Transcript_3615/g.7903  ORF Transcript_3615/g.7903 Transcript_3615/m.7903 type:complete len:377 (-) Transcript_3615:420-1550(-)